METLEETLKTILEKSVTLAEKSGEFVLEQAPDLLQQFFMWHSWRHGLGIILGVVFIIIGMILPSIWATKDGDYRFFLRSFDEFDGEAGGIASVCVGFFAGIMVISIHTYKLIYITVAPKLYLIDYFLSGGNA